MRHVFSALTLTLALGTIGCTAVQQQEPTGLAAEVADKAQQVSQQIGGTNGFGGTWMNGYGEHMATHMGFYGMSYLADPDANLGVQLVNGSDWPCTFHIAYVRGSNGLDEQYEDVTVPPGRTVTMQMPCAEIVGVGSVEEVGVVAADLGNGTEYDNWMCVPGFLNSDYACGGTFRCTLAPDTDDLDNDGDTEELIVVTSGLQSHIGPGGMQQHMWTSDGSFGAMMGGWMMGSPRQ